MSDEKVYTYGGKKPPLEPAKQALVDKLEVATDALSELAITDLDSKSLLNDHELDAIVHAIGVLEHTKFKLFVKWGCR